MWMTLGVSTQRYFIVKNLSYLSVEIWKMKATAKRVAEQCRSSAVQAVLLPLNCWIQRALWTHVRVPLHKLTAPDRSEIPALTGSQFNHMSMNKVGLWEYRAGSQNNIVAGMLPRMSKCFRSGRKRTIQSLEAHKITWSQRQIQKYNLNVASAKHLGIGSGKYIYLTFSSEVIWEASNNLKIGSWILCVSFVLLRARNAESSVGP